jgi:hypothetical protein
MSQQTGRIYIDGFLLRILDSAYLVQVQAANGRTGRYVRPSSLPAWIFKSPHAIWMTEEDGPLIERARKGDEIKQRIWNKGENQ